MKESNRGFKRVSKAKVKEACKKSRSGGFSSFHLPDGVSTWVPEKEGTYKLDIVPFVVSVDNHPDDGIEKGVVWWRMFYGLHRNIGVNNSGIVCPTSIGKPCPICEYRNELSKNYEENEKAIKPLKVQKMAAVNILDPKDPDNIMVFPYSRFSFMEKLDKEVEKAEDESDTWFYETTKDGRTLKVRFDDTSFKSESGASGKFLKAESITFSPRGVLDENDILSRTVKLDSALIVKSYDEIQELFDGGSSEESDDSDDVEESPKRKTRSAPVEEDDEQEADDEPTSPSKKKSKPAPVEDDEDEDAQDEPEEPPVKTKKSKPPIVEDDDDEEDDSDLFQPDEEEEEEEEDVPPPKMKKKSKPPVDEDD